MINKFIGDYAFLSNFYEAPVEYRGRIYSNNEAAFQAQKTFDATLQQQFETLGPIEARNQIGRASCRERVCLDV